MSITSPFNFEPFSATRKSAFVFRAEMYLGKVLVTQILCGIIFCAKTTEELPINGVVVNLVCFEILNAVVKGLMKRTLEIRQICGFLGCFLFSVTEIVLIRLNLTYCT